MELFLFFPCLAFLLGFLLMVGVAFFLVRFPLRSFLVGSNIWVISFFLTLLSSYILAEGIYFLPLAEENQDFILTLLSPTVEALFLMGLLFFWVKSRWRNSPFLESHEMWGVGVGLGGAKILALFFFNLALSYRVYVHPEQFPQTFLDTFTSFSWSLSFVFPGLKAGFTISFFIFLSFVFFHGLDKKNILWIFMSIVLKALVGYGESLEEKMVWSKIYFVACFLLAGGMMALSFQLQQKKTAILVE